MARYKLGEIYGELRLKSKDFQQNLKKSSQLTKVTSQGMMMAFGAVTLAIGAMGTALGKVTKTIMRYGLEIDKSAKVTGLTTTEIQKLRYAADQEHASIQALEKGIMNLNVRLGYAGDEMVSYTRYFEALGIAYRNTQGSLRSAYDVFGDLFDVMSKGKLTTEETAAVMQLLGARSAKELIPMLKKGKEWFQKMGDEADRLGIVLDEDTIRLIKETDDEITKLKGSLRGTAYLVGEILVPFLNDTARVLTRVVLQVRALTEATTLSEKAYRLLSLVLPGFIKPLEEARIDQVVNQMKQLKEEGKENTIVYQMLSAELKFLWGEFDSMGGVSIPNFNKKLKAVRETTRETKKETEMLSGAFLGVGQDLHEMDHAYLDIQERTKDWTEQTRALGAVLGRVLKQGKMDISSLLQIAISFIPGGGFLKGFLGGLFGEGGVAVPKKWQPIFAAEGMAVAEKPTVSPGGNIYGERGWEVFMKGDQFKEILKPPTIIIHNANPETYVEIIRNSSESDKYKFGRFLEDDVLNKQRYLNR